MHADRDHMRPGDSRAGGWILPRGEDRDRAAVLLFGGQHGDAGRLQPRLGPGAHILPGGLLQAGEEVSQRRIAERVPREIRPGGGSERFTPSEGGQLLEH